MTDIQIEDDTKLISPVRSAVEKFFTALMWIIWGYLFLPMATLIVWFVIGRYMHRHLIESAGLSQLADMILRMGWLVLIIFIVLRGWGYYNYYVFGRKNRRKTVHKVTAGEIGDHFGLNEETVHNLQEQKEIYWPWNC